MSLTNPKKIVTEERLSEFYNGILPYLGGMPDLLANKFNRSDLYSTDEKLIGRWIDGKPLYQIVVTLPNGHGEIAPNTWQTLTTLDIPIDRIVFSVLMSGDTTSPACCLYWSLRFDTSNNHLDAIQSRNMNVAISNNSCIIMQYTKTTDSTTSIGVDTDYSTTEKIVGTWIDGKPIYQKTIEFGTLPKNTSKQVQHNVSNVDKIWVADPSFAINSSGLSIRLPIVNDTNQTFQCALYASTTYVEIEARQKDWSAFTGYITIQYTKTS